MNTSDSSATLDEMIAKEAEGKDKNHVITNPGVIGKFIDTILGDENNEALKIA
jgi:hypothetical protein